MTEEDIDICHRGLGLYRKRNIQFYSPWYVISYYYYRPTMKVRKGMLIRKVSIDLSRPWNIFVEVKKIIRAIKHFNKIKDPSYSISRPTYESDFELVYL